MELKAVFVCEDIDRYYLERACDCLTRSGLHPAKDPVRLLSEDDEFEETDNLRSKSIWDWFVSERGRLLFLFFEGGPAKLCLTIDLNFRVISLSCDLDALLDHQPLDNISKLWNLAKYLERALGAKCFSIGCELDKEDVVNGLSLSAIGRYEPP